jgi:hypothetical protein
MSKFQKHLELVLKHYPKKKTEDDTVIRKLAEICALAGAEEQDIAELCEALSDEFDSSFTNGIHAGQGAE